MENDVSARTKIPIQWHQQAAEQWAVKNAGLLMARRKLQEVLPIIESVNPMEAKKTESTLLYLEQLLAIE